MQNSNDIYSPIELLKIIKGYSMLNSDGHLTSLLRQISNCRQCVKSFHDRVDHPINRLVRPVDLSRLMTNEAIENFSIGIKRDNTLLRNIFQKNFTTREIIKRTASAKFAIGLNPWLDRCMLFRKSRKTRLMIIGIDYKHFPVFYRNSRDHHFPLDSYLKKNNIWGPTWKKFWTKLLDEPYDDNKVNAFIKKEGVFFTNSMLCFGGSENPQSHCYGYLKCCRDFIKEMIKIVKPEVLVSFGTLGCRNVASILKEENQGNEILTKLKKSSSPLKEMPSIAQKMEFGNGIRAFYNSSVIVFWPLYQPAWSHIYKYRGDYTKLRHLLDLG
jgi:hypothetical protein